MSTQGATRTQKTALRVVTALGAVPDTDRGTVVVITMVIAPEAVFAKINKEAVLRVATALGAVPDTDRGTVVVITTVIAPEAVFATIDSPMQEVSPEICQSVLFRPEMKQTLLKNQ